MQWFIEQAFDKSWILNVNEICRKYPQHQGNSITGIEKTKEENYLMNLIPSEKEPMLADSLRKIAKKANEQKYGFNIWYDSDIIQYTTYTSDKQMTYPWHWDSIWFGRPVVQKLTVIVCLTNSNDYDGGELVLSFPTMKPIKLNEGQAIVFPSIVAHQVNPVTRGTRNTLVTWYKGPRWQ